MADVDGYLAICGPPFFPHELVLEQLAENRILNNLVDEADGQACADHKSAHMKMTNMSTAKYYTKQHRTHHRSVKEKNVAGELTPVPVTRGKRGLCYDLNQVSDMRMRNRILKNRESADQSRKRKILALKRHEDLLAEQDAENKRLMDINAALLSRIAEIEVALDQHTALRHGGDAQSLS
jgi:phage regulator Rha-like protein